MGKTDYTEIRYDTMLLNGLSSQKMNQKYHLYYDETGNCRRFWIKDGHYNVEPFSFFVLGGIATFSSNPNDLQLLKNEIGIDNPTITEIKAKHILRKGASFEECLKQQRFQNYLDFLIKEKWFVHFAVVDLFYFSIVDIVDSLGCIDQDVFNLKEELYRILRYNMEGTLNLMIQYEYPDVRSENISNFLIELTGMIDTYIADTGKANIYTYKLRLYIQLGLGKQELVFIQSETGGELLHDFLPFYIRPIYMFINSSIIFDEEKNIHEMMKDEQLIIEGKVLDNYQFVDSCDDVMIQMSDVFVSVMAKYLQYVNEFLDNVHKRLEVYDETQRNAFIKLNYLLELSVAENSAFGDMFMSSDTRRVFSQLVDEYSQKIGGE